MKTKKEGLTPQPAQIKNEQLKDTDFNSDLQLDSVNPPTQSSEDRLPDSNNTLVELPLALPDRIEILNSKYTEILVDRYAVLIEYHLKGVTKYRIFKRAYNLGHGNIVFPEGKSVWTTRSLDKAKTIFYKVCDEEQKWLKKLLGEVIPPFDLFDEPNYKKSEAVKQIEFMVYEYHRAQLPLIPSQYISFPYLRDDTSEGLIACIILYLSLSGHRTEMISKLSDLRKNYNILEDYCNPDILATINGCLVWINISYIDGLLKPDRDEIMASNEEKIPRLQVGSFESFMDWYTKVFSERKD